MTAALDLAALDPISRFPIGEARHQRIRSAGLKRDREYFQQHPHMRIRVRPLLLGEVLPVKFKPDALLVAANLGPLGLIRFPCTPATVADVVELCLKAVLRLAARDAAGTKEKP